MYRISRLKSYMKDISRSMFFKIFLACISLSFSIITIMGIYNYFFIQRTYSEEIERFEQRKLDETLNTIDIFFGEMKKLSISYTLNPDVQRHLYMPRENVIEKYSEIKKLQESFASDIASSSYIKNIFVYSEKNGHILDFSGLTTAEAFYDLGWLDDYKEMASNYEIIGTRKVKFQSSPNGATYEEIISLITKLPYAGLGRDGALILNLDCAIISDLLRNITLDDKNSFACIVNSNGEIMASSNKQYIHRNISDVLHSTQTLYVNDEGRFDLSLDGINMTSFYKTSRLNSWKLYYIAPENIIFQKSEFAKSIIINICLILLVAIIILSFLLSYKVYGPVKKLVSNIKAKIGANGEDISDIKTIQTGLDFLFESRKNLEQQVNRNKILAREAFITRLVTGKLFNPTEIKNRAEYFEISLDFPYFKVVVIKKYHTSPDTSLIDEDELKKIGLANIIQKAFDNTNVKIDFSYDQSDDILLLIKYSRLMDMNELEAVVEQILEEIKEKAEKLLFTSISLGVGRIYSDLLNIVVSYKEAVEALQYEFLKGGQSIISIEEIRSKEIRDIYYPVDKEQKLISLIKLNDYEKSFLCLKDMINEIMLHNNKFENIETCLSNITGIIQRCIFELNLKMKEVFEEDHPANITLDKFKNVEEYVEWIGGKFHRIIDYQSTREKSSTADLNLKIRDYIEDSYMKELSLQSVSDYFNYSPPYFCKMFKEKIGMSFWDYVTKIRMEKSKKLLSETDLGIEKVAFMVGYNNRFSYVRTFKKYTMYTPHEYRQKCLHNSTDTIS